jgi:hypothetical protein
MRLSCIINTSCLGPRAQSVTGSTTPTPHAFREHVLRNFILPHYAMFADEVIVVGEFREGAKWRYIPKPSIFFSAVDALHQRQAGFEASTGDVLLFAHDDHLVYLKDIELSGGHVAVPRRVWRRPDGRVVTVNNGFSAGYVSGHAAFYMREVLEVAPWGGVPLVHTWDIEHTRQLRAQGAVIVEAPKIVAWDVEVGADPTR